MMLLALAACGQAATPQTPADQAPAADPAPAKEGSEDPLCRLCHFRSGGDFFQMLADGFVDKMEAEGWQASLC